MSLSKDSQTSLLPGGGRSPEPPLEWTPWTSQKNMTSGQKWMEAQIEISPLLTANSVNSSACIRLQHFYGL